MGQGLWFDLTTGATADSASGQLGFFVPWAGYGEEVWTVRTRGAGLRNLVGGTDINSCAPRTLGVTDGAWSDTLSLRPRSLFIVKTSDNAFGIVHADSLEESALTVSWRYRSDGHDDLDLPSDNDGFTGWPATVEEYVQLQIGNQWSYEGYYDGALVGGSCKTFPHITIKSHGSAAFQEWFALENSIWWDCGQTRSRVLSGEPTYSKIDASGRFVTSRVPLYPSTGGFDRNIRNLEGEIIWIDPDSPCWFAGWSECSESVPEGLLMSASVEQNVRFG